MKMEIYEADAKWALSMGEFFVLGMMIAIVLAVGVALKSMGEPLNGALLPLYFSLGGFMYYHALRAFEIAVHGESSIP